MLASAALALLALPAPDGALLRELATLEAHKQRVRTVEFAPDGTLVSGGQDRLVCRWSADGELLQKVDLWPGGG